MAALSATKHNPVIKEYYNHLLKLGKAKKLALTACMRKLLTMLNAMVKNNQKWQCKTI
jgi:transposase